ncbi:FkbM family methyltransferase [Halocatena marina]|uniref:FkbM family methyltransferase n=1 Tax=Halocatena marina TaxID=2934937 RepID=A0ABD5YK21_9EURY|nr:FkbM family methyltransferase [Halocatena marina]
MKNRLLAVGSRLADRYGVLPIAGAIYWKVDTAYCLVRVATIGELDAEIAGQSVRFDLSTRSEYRRAKNLGGERAVIEALLSELSGAETVWDIGASVGTYTCFIASALTTGCVVGFEPESTNRSRLRMNLEQNELTGWEIASFALSNENGTCTLSSEFVEAGAGHHYLSSDGTGPTVETRRGDTLVDKTEYAPPDIVKIDVQGAELAVLSGLRGVLDGVRSIFLEVHPDKCDRYDTTAEEIEAFLTTSGFSLTQLGEPTTRRSGVYFIHASR